MYRSGSTRRNVSGHRQRSSNRATGPGPPVSPPSSSMSTTASRSVSSSTDGRLLPLPGPASSSATRRCARVTADRTYGSSIASRSQRAGRPARWDLLAMLEPYVRSAVTRAHRRVALEEAGPGSGSSRPSVLDDTDLDAVVDMLLLGGDTGGPGPVARLLDRCLCPDTF